MTVKMNKGDRYGRLALLSNEPYRFKDITNLSYRCICDCGSVIFAEGSKLRKGRVSSCGCLQRESQQRNLSKNLDSRVIVNLKIKDTVKYEIHTN